MARQFTWHPADGSTPLLLTDEMAGYRVKANGTRGLHSPTYRTTRRAYAGQPGTTLEAIQADEREFSLGLQVTGSTAAEFRARWRALVRAMRPMAGDGVLEVADEDGQVRSITCRYDSGLEGDAAVQFSGVEGRAVVTLLAFDPWWYGAAQTIEFGLGEPVPFFTPTDGFPLTLSPSAVQGDFTVDLSDSDAPAYPTWTITGPGSSLTLTNSTTGQAIQVNADIPDGETVVIDTRPNFQSVRRGDGTNLLASLATDPALWALVEGVNQISVAMTDATGDSRISGLFRPRYAGV